MGKWKNRCIMCGLSCKICFKLYNQNVSPRLLPCGHTCCTTCLTKILHDNNNRCCPLCRESLEQTDAGQYKINYALMEMCEEFSNSPWNIKALRRRLEVMSKEHKSVLSSAKEIVSIAMGNMLKITLMESDENKMLEFIGKEDEEIDGKEAHEALDAIEKLMIEVGALFPIKNERILPFITSYNLIDFSDYSEFLTKIYNEVGKGQKIESLLLINGTRKAARISISDNILLVHAFRPSSEDKLAIQVEFSDLKKCLLRRVLYAFLNLTYTDAGVRHMIFIKNFTQSILVSKFLKLCTGESGPSYLDSTFTSPQTDEKMFLKSSSFAQRQRNRACNFNLSSVSVVTVPEHSIRIVGVELPQQLNWEEQYYAYISGLNSDCSALPKEDYYLTLETNGTFQISKTEKIPKGSTVIGTVIDDSSKLVQKFQHTTKGVVIDCGIAVML